MTSPSASPPPSRGKSHLDCPVCGVALVRYDTRDKWRCRRCNGALVGFAQLEVEIGELAEIVLDDPPDPARIAARPCPVCAYAMSPYTVYEHPLPKGEPGDPPTDPATTARDLLAPALGIELDRCTNDDVVWFDGGEIGKLRTALASAAAADDEPVLTRLVQLVLEADAFDHDVAAGKYDDLPLAEPVTFAEGEWETRILCGDGGCTGIIGANGLCDVCAQPLK